MLAPAASRAAMKSRDRDVTDPKNPPPLQAETVARRKRPPGADRTPKSRTGNPLIH